VRAINLSKVIYIIITISIYQWETACTGRDTNIHIDDSVTSNYRQIPLLLRSNVVHDSIYYNDNATFFRYNYKLNDMTYFNCLTVDRLETDDDLRVGTIIICIYDQSVKFN